MTRLEFLQEIFKFFGKKDEDLLRAYDLALTTKENIDWDKLYKKVITEVESRYLPAPKWFISQFPNYVIYDDKNYRYKGGNAILVLKRHNKPNLFYVFPMDYAEHTISEYCEHFKKKYENSFVSFKYYPPEFSIIGRKIFDKDMKLCEEV